MKKIAAALVVATLAGALAACGSNTSNDAAADAVVANDEVVQNDAIALDADLALSNDALLDNGAAQNVLTPTDNAR